MRAARGRGGVAARPARGLSRWPSGLATTRPPSRSPTRPRGGCGPPNTTARVSIPTSSARGSAESLPPRCTERNVDGKRVGPRDEQADNTSGPTWPIERVASPRRIPSWPESLRLTPRPNTRLQPRCLPDSDLLGYLQWESIHELLGLTHAVRSSAEHTTALSAPISSSGSAPSKSSMLKKSHLNDSVAT